MRKWRTKAVLMSCPSIPSFISGWNRQKILGMWKNGRSQPAARPQLQSSRRWWGSGPRCAAGTWARGQVDAAGRPVRTGDRSSVARWRRWRAADRPAAPRCSCRRRRGSPPGRRRSSRRWCRLWDGTTTRAGCRPAKKRLKPKSEKNHFQYILWP